MVKIRLKRMGRRHRPFYRIAAMEVRAPRDGRVLEELGYYDPMVKDVEKQVKLDTVRAKHWLDHGAQASDTVRDILKKQGVELKK